MNSVGTGGDSDVGAGVDEELCGGAVELFEDAAGEVGEDGGGQVFFAELDIVDAGGCPTGGLADEGGEFGVPPFAVRLQESSVGDGVAEHGVSVWDWGFLSANERIRRRGALMLLW